MKTQTKLIALFLLLFIFVTNLYSQFYQQKISSYNINDAINDKITYVRDIEFVNIHTGFLVTIEYLYDGNNYIGDVLKIFKTTNSGINWNKIFSQNLSIVQNVSRVPSISFKNENNGIVSCLNLTIKTADAGSTWNVIYNSLSDLENTMIEYCPNNNIFMIQEFTSYVYKILTNQSLGLVKNFGSGIRLQYITTSQTNPNIIYVGGHKVDQNNSRPFLHTAKIMGIAGLNS